MNLEPWSIVRQGSDPANVRAVQYLLRARGGALAADGQYGPQTLAAVRAFQLAQGLTADGIVGPATWPRLVVVTRLGSAGDAVRAVQQFGLIRSPIDPPLAVDGVYGPVTSERVRHFQEAWGLTVDAVAGRETFSFLRDGVAIPHDPRWPLVKVGASQGSNRRVLPAQYLLRARGHAIAADGAFGPASGQAVRSFQQTLRSTEISTTLGQLDWPNLVIIVRRGDTGDSVRAAQTLVGVAPDGVFGPATEAAVRLFQGVFTRTDDGIVGPITWRLLAQPLFK